MTVRGLRILRPGRHPHRWTLCRRCRRLAAESDMFEVARPGASRGVWWCDTCAADLRGDSDE